MLRPLRSALFLVATIVAIAGCGSEGKDTQLVEHQTSGAYSVEDMQSEQVNGVWIHHRPSDSSLGALSKGTLTASPTGCLTLEDGTPLVWNSFMLEEARAYALQIAAGEKPAAEIGGGLLAVGTAIPVDDLTPEFIDHCMPAEMLWLN